MAEQTDALVNPVLQKKIDGYRMDNFSVQQELTVTITLSEYRDLVTNAAVCNSKVNEATQARWKVEKECNDLRSTLTEVKNALERARNDLLEANKQRLEAITQLEELRSPSLTTVKKSKK